MYGPLTQLGRYEILGKIASGGMATVYRARMEGAQGFSKIVALKIMHPHLAEDEHHVTMFMDEGRLSARFTHPNLVSVFDHGDLDAYRFMAMEYHPGLTLSRLWRHLREKEVPLSLGMTLHIIRESLQGLDYAHNLTDEQGAPLEIIHRDVSPENILLTQQGTVKVLDFGIALDNARRAVSRTGIVKGKISYMSPEQVTGKSLDRRSDIYATAVMAYEMISGHHLFGDGTTEEIRRRIANAVKSPVKKGAIPHEGIEMLLRKALSHEPEERFRTASCFRDEVDRVMSEEGWQTEAEHLASAVREATEEIEKEEERKRKASERQAARKKSREQGKGDESQNSSGLGILWFARVSVALLAISLMFEIFGVRVSVTTSESHAASPETNAEFEQPLDAPTDTPQFDAPVTDDSYPGFKPEIEKSD